MNQLKIIFAGNTKAGKTALLRALRGAAFKDNFISTIGVDLSVIRKNNCKLQCWDLAGANRFECVTKVYYKDAAVIVICISTQDEEEPAKIVDRILTLKDQWCNPDVKFILVATQIDRSYHQISVHHIQQVANRLNMPFIATSAKTREGCDQLLHELFSKVDVNAVSSFQIDLLEGEKYQKMNPSCCQIW